MSLIPPGTAPSFDITLYSSVQVAVTTAALYDHVLSLGREVELIWMKHPSLVTVLYVIERYLGDVVLVAGLCLCFSTSKSQAEYVNAFQTVPTNSPNILSSLDVSSRSIYFFFRLTVRGGIRLFEFRAWGALAYAWATQATMQLRIYAMYKRSRQILILLLTTFFCEIAAIAFVIWRTIGPDSSLQSQASSGVVPGEHFCSFSGVKTNFVYLFIPFLCFEFFLFILAGRMFLENMKRNRQSFDEKGSRLNPESFMNVLARDSLFYFFVNLVACAVVMCLWQTVTELYANICVPFVMFLEVLVGTKLILDFRERYARSDQDPVSTKHSSLRFGDDAQRNSAHISVRCHVETVVISDVEP